MAIAAEAPELAEGAEGAESSSGLKRGAAVAPSTSQTNISLPKGNDDQSTTWELLVILGIVVMLISPIGKWLGGIVQEITTHHDVTLNWNPFAQSSTSSGTTSSPAPSTSTSGGGSNAAIGHYTVNLAGGGQMTVNASSPQAAVENVKAEGGTAA